VQTVDLKKSFGCSVRVWRSRLGISQEELGGRAGLHRTYVSDIERGARNVSLESIEKLSGALQVSVSTLFGDPSLTPSDAVHAAPIDILLIEDSPSDIALTTEALKVAGVVNRIEIVTDGAAALDHIFGVGANRIRREPLRRPHLILLDLGLPRIDGLEVLRTLKANERTRSIPVIVLTASDEEQDRIASRHLGADGYVVKPVGLTGLSKVTPGLSLQWALLGPGRRPD
jgi:CheY-like chemotaxis protein/DNA-binding XRE family transcriptional regulator